MNYTDFTIGRLYERIVSIMNLTENEEMIEVTEYISYDTDPVQVGRSLREALCQAIEEVKEVGLQLELREAGATLTVRVIRETSFRF